MLAEQGIFSVSLLMLMIPAALVQLGPEQAEPTLEQTELRRKLAGLDTHALAFLRGGERAVLETAVVALMRQGSLRVQSNGSLAPTAEGYRNPATLPSSTNTLEAEVLATLTRSPGLELRELEAQCAAEISASRLREQLIRAGLWLEPRAQRERQWLARLSSALVVGIAVLALVSAMGTGALLPCVLALLATTALLWPVHAQLVHGRALSPEGRQLLRSLDEPSPLREHVARRRARLSPEQLAYAHAAFGEELCAKRGMSWGDDAPRARN